MSKTNELQNIIKSIGNPYYKKCFTDFMLCAEEIRYAMDGDCNALGIEPIDHPAMTVMYDIIKSYYPELIPDSLVPANKNYDFSII